MRDLRIEIVPADELPPGVIEAIKKSNDREFGWDKMVYDVPEKYVLGLVGETLASFVGILQREITVDKKALWIGGVLFLVTEPEYRGRGFGHAVMDKAIDIIRTELKLPFCLLTCQTRLGELYDKWGWKSASAACFYDQPTGRRACGGLTMIYKCGDQPWPPGEIDLRGLPW